MARHDDTSSTERLLDLIRSKDNKNSNISDSKFPYLVTSRPAFSFRKLFLYKKKVLGLDIGNHFIKILQLTHISDNSHELIGYSIKPFESGSFGTPEFTKFLKSAIKEVCNSSKPNIWVMISREKIETRYFKIPKIPKKQISNAVYLKYKKLVSFNETEHIFDFEILGGIEDTQEIEIRACITPKYEIKRLKEIFTAIGFPLTGISVYSFALQNLIKYQYIKTNGQIVCCLFVGMHSSRIDIFFADGSLAFSRTIKSCIYSMIEEINKYIDSNPILSERYLHQAHKIFFNFIDNELSVEESVKPKDFIETNNIFTIIMPALDRLIWNIKRSIEYFQTHIGTDRVEKIYISGDISENKFVIDYIGKKLDNFVDNNINPFSSEKLITKNISIPESLSQRNSFMPVLGIALSRNFFTPNFIFTYKDKIRYINTKKFNCVLVVFFLLLIIFCATAYWGQRYLIAQKNLEIVTLQNKLNQHIKKNGLYIDQEIIKLQSSFIKQKRKNIKSYVRKYLSISVLENIVNSTPSYIRLINLYLNLTETKDEAEKIKNSINIEGIIKETPLGFENALAIYLKNLNKKPIFGNFTILKKNKGVFKNKSIIRFTVDLEIIIED